jgi:hypothetical protein
VYLLPLDKAFDMQKGLLYLRYMDDGVPRAQKRCAVCHDCKLNLCATV